VSVLPKAVARRVVGGQKKRACVLEEVPWRAGGLMGVQPTSEAGNTAYKAGMCVDCRTRRYSAGRPRCDECHEARIQATVVPDDAQSVPEWTDDFVENTRRLSFVERVTSRQLFDQLAARRADTRSFIARLEEWAGHTERSTQPRRRTEVGDIAQPGTNPAYAATAIRADLERLAAATEGVRNHTLIAVACNVFEFVKAGHADGPACRAEIERIANAIGLPDREIQTTLRSAWGRVGPRSVPAPAGVAPAYIIESQTP
jgi:hypothetical protein